ncbi:hypothetical protein [Xenorhabdus sp. BG5]|uniref:hypothetical protein n=1 Tax=Xenorhabdus sp. BG5 TaxID=2782014 RepID=UPI0018800314|nr:hypothetical protein [Xenorhabdus sp. BG5]MBE8597861.1 hypothetical protein [Xenorhabdus sp. BG5]
MKNKPEDLNNHLFAQIERLSDETISGEQLELEFRRAKSISAIAAQIVNNGRLALDVKKSVDIYD